MKPQVATIEAELRLQLPTPKLASVSPAVGFSGGGNAVTLKGTGFSSGMQIFIGTSPCYPGPGFSPTEVTCFTSPGPAGPQDVSVLTLDGQHSALSQAFKYDLEAFTRLDPFVGNVATSGSADGAGRAAQFNKPQGLSFDGTNIYVADANNNLIRKIVVASAQTTTIGGDFNTTSSLVESDSTAQEPLGLFYVPLSSATDGKNVYLADQLGNIIRQINLSTGNVTTIAGTTVPDNMGYQQSGLVNGSGTQVRFDQPVALALSSKGILYISDYGNSVIRQMVLSTGQVTTLAGVAGTAAPLDGPITCPGNPNKCATFGSLAGIALDEAHNDLYIADSGGNAPASATQYYVYLIRVLHLSTGMVVTVAGDPTGTGPQVAGPAFPIGFQDGIGLMPPTAAEFGSPDGLAVVGSSLYIADVFDNAIRKMDLTTYRVTTLLGSPDVNVDTPGGLSKAGLKYPTSLVFDPASGLYVGDSTTISRIH
jgi:hypothetical protein